LAQGSKEQSMKVVLFCGGLGTRLREHSDTIPKPLVNIGIRPIIWHLMRYYAHYGHKDFVLALGYRGDMIREYFLRYNQCLSTDFVWSKGGQQIELLGDDISDWRITFVDTGMHSNLGQRLLKVRRHVESEEMFLVNYSDGLSDLDLAPYVAEAHARGAIASFAAVRPSQSFHAVHFDADGAVSAMEPVSKADAWVNGGFFCLRREIFDYIQEGEELVEEPFARLIAQRKLWAMKHYGFWAAMDTFKDKITFDRMEARGHCPWMVWNR
jgi:glucose-1-phosphate cytidylyltransferase